MLSFKALQLPTIPGNRRNIFVNDNFNGLLIISLMCNNIYCNIIENYCLQLYMQMVTIRNLELLIYVTPLSTVLI